MRKYFNSLLVALLATMPFVLTSCGDDDEPDNGSSSSFTVNGEAYVVRETSGEYFTIDKALNVTQVDLELYPAKSDEYDLYPRVHVNIQTDALSTPVSEGTKLNVKDNNSTYAEMTTGFMTVTRYTEYKSGSVTVSSVSSSSVTLKFDNVKFADSNDEVITLNGTISCEYEEL